MTIETEMIKASAQIEADSILKDKPEEFVDGFYVGLMFMLDYLNALLHSYGLIIREKQTD